jgi:lysophospholipase L1-like esterase
MLFWRVSVQESEFKVRFNLQNFLKEDIDEDNFERIGSILDIDQVTVRNIALDLRRSAEKQAGVLDKERKYSSFADKSLPCKVIFIGDSITSDRESFAHIISSVFSNQDRIRFINAGVSGWRTTEFLDDLYSKVLNCEADIAHVMLGTNGVRRSRFDYGKCNVSPEEFEKNIRYILRALAEHRTHSIISTLPPYDLGCETYSFGNWTVEKSDYDAYNDIIAKSSEMQGCILNDMRNIYSEYDPKELLEEDGVHLNKTGHYILAEQVIGKLAEMIEK